jgi:hypothetical protein
MVGLALAVRAFPICSFSLPVCFAKGLKKHLRGQPGQVGHFWGIMTPLSGLPADIRTFVFIAILLRGSHFTWTLEPNALRGWHAGCGAGGEETLPIDGGAGMRIGER